MASIALERSDVIVGVDTHKDQHVAVALDGLGGDLDDISIAATKDGYAVLLVWAAGLGRVVAFGVEGCGSYGIGLARFLRRHGHKVIEVHRPPRKGERRLAGKNDLIDARHAASEVLAGNALATPKTAGGSIESIRLVKIARDTAVKAHSMAMITLKATLVTATDELRGELEPLSDFKLITVCAALPGNGDLSDPADAMRHVLGALGRRWLELHEEIKVHSRQLKSLTKQAAPELLEAFGIGPDIAGELLAAAGDNTDRIRSEAAFAKCAGRAPSRPGRARPTDATGSTGAGTARQTRLSTDV